MNIFSIFASLFVSYCGMIPFIILGMYLNSPSGKGIVGEWIVNFKTSFMLDKSIYHLIKNVTLVTEDGTTQIDHIIVSKFGVFVIETKNFGGWIFGSIHQKMWTQKFPHSSRQFQNPLHQNYKHVRVLEEILGMESQIIFSVIVFVGDSTFKTTMPDNVVNHDGYLPYIESKIKPVLSNDQVTAIVYKIRSGRLTPSLKVSRDHIQHVKHLRAEKVTEVIDSSSGDVDQLRPCPTCGSRLVLRTASRGSRRGMEFVGCSGFPQCRYVKSTNKLKN